MEYFAAIKSNADPIPVVQQFLQAVQERPEKLMQIVKRLILSLRTKDARQRGNMAFALSQLARRMKKNLNANEVYKLTTQTLEMGTDTVDLRHNTIAVFMSWSALSRSGLFIGQKEIILGMIRNTHGYSNESISIRNIGYATLWAIIDSNFKTTEEFKEFAFREILGELGSIMAPPHADSMELWLKIDRKYAGLTLKPWVKTPTAAAILRSMASVFEETLKVLPAIHSIWTYMARLDSMQLVRNTVEIWGKVNSKNKLVPLVAITAAFAEMDVNSFLSVFKNESLVEYIRSIRSLKESSILSEAAVAACDRFVSKSAHRAAALCTVLVKAFSSKGVSKFASRLSDSETREVMLAIEGDFEANLELLWGQIHRDSLEDTSIINELFGRLLEQKEDHVEELRTLLAHSVDAITGDGRHWLGLLTGAEILPMIATDEKGLVQRTSAIVAASKKLHEEIGADCAIPDVDDLGKLVEASNGLMDSECEFCKTLGRSVAKSALDYLDDDQFIKLATDPYVLIRAATSKKFCTQAIQHLVSQTKKMPRSLLLSANKLQFDADEATAETVLDKILESNASSNAFVSNIFTALARKLPEERLQEFAARVMKGGFDHIGVNDEDFVVPFLKVSSAASEAVVDAILANANPSDSAAHLRRYQLWLEKATSRTLIDAEKIGHALEKVVNFPDGDGRADRNKKENALVWLASFLTQQKRAIPLFSLEEKVKSLANSQSTRTQQLVETINNTLAAYAEMAEEDKKE